jgi:dGTPase
LGHTPFGHAGERALDACVTGGFRHYEQSVRTVERIEKGGAGLNLTLEVLDGIRCHTNLSAKTLEGRVVRFADRIAYMNHDIEDAISAHVLSEQEIPAEVRQVLGGAKAARIDHLVKSVVENSRDDIRMEDKTFAAYEGLHQFLLSTVYCHPVGKKEEGKVGDLVKRLFNYFAQKPDKLPGEYGHIYETEGAERAACDYIAGMTDRFALQVFDDLFIPHVWQVKG